jgi:hypothetical protein
MASRALQAEFLKTWATTPGGMSRRITVAASGMFQSFFQRFSL